MPNATHPSAAIAAGSEMSDVLHSAGEPGAGPRFDMGVVSIEAERLAALMAQVSDMLERYDERLIRRACFIAEAAEQLAQSLCDRAGALS